jgi:hypothetical protein
VAVLAYLGHVWIGLVVFGLGMVAKYGYDLYRRHTERKQLANEGFNEFEIRVMLGPGRSFPGVIEIGGYLLGVGLIALTDYYVGHRIYGVYLSRIMPANAIVLADHNRRTYLAPVCVENPRRYPRLTAAQADAAKYDPDPKCRDRGAFVEYPSSITAHIVEAVQGRERPPRWNTDGSWNW